MGKRKQKIDSSKETTITSRYVLIDNHLSFKISTEALTKYGIKVLNYSSFGFSHNVKDYPLVSTAAKQYKDLAGNQMHFISKDKSRTNPSKDDNMNNSIAKTEAETGMKIIQISYPHGLKTNEALDLLIPHLIDDSDELSSNIRRLNIDKQGRKKPIYKNKRNEK